MTTNKERQARFRKRMKDRGYTQLTVMVKPEQKKEVLELLETGDRPKRPKCLWTYDQDLDTWDTQCDNSFMLNEGTPSDNQMNYCPYCGHEIKQGEQHV